MLVGKIEDTFATVYRQIAMNRFEHAIHQSRRAQGELSADRFADAWTETQEAMFQGSVTLTDDYRIWWSYIPHFVHTPGYVYAYSFGELLVLALYARYQSEGGDFGERYIEMLSAGGSDWPHDLMKPLGVDLTDPGFWNEGVALVEQMVSDAEKLAAELGSPAAGGRRPAAKLQQAGQVRIMPPASASSRRHTCAGCLSCSPLRSARSC